MTKASVVGACILLASTAALGDGWRSIPAGREPLLMTMLGHGAALPGGCRFDGGTNAGFITAEFACGDGRVVVQLRNPDDAPGVGGGQLNHGWHVASVRAVVLS